MTTTTPATDRETLLEIAGTLEIAGRPSMSTQLRAIASRLATKPECNHEYASRVVNHERRTICKHCGDERIDAKTEEKPVAIATPTQFCDKCGAIKEDTGFPRGVVCWRCPPAKPEAAKGEATEPAPDSLEGIIEELEGTCTWTGVRRAIDRLRSLHSPQPEMPESVASLIDDLRATSSAFDRQIAAVRAHYAAAPAKEGEVPVVRVTHGVECCHEPGAVFRLGTEAACRSYIGGNKDFRLVRLDFGSNERTTP